MAKGRHLVPAFFIVSTTSGALRICMATMCKPNRKVPVILPNRGTARPGGRFRR
jgi:hypothetical protein